MFTKQHYIQIAKIIARSKDKQEIIAKMCEFFKHDNSIFNETLFRAYIAAYTMEG